MNDAEFLRKSFVALEVSAKFSKAVLRMQDGSHLTFCHKVGERLAKAADEASLAGQVLSRLRTFRLNARHLDIHFEDGSRWEAAFGDAGRAR
jgi:hypothetical protein